MVSLFNLFVFTELADPKDLSDSFARKAREALNRPIANPKTIETFRTYLNASQRAAKIKNVVQPRVK